MRRKIGLLLVIVVSVSSIPIAEATVKAGMKCGKLNSTAIVGSKKFTCIKSGSKLIWNRGVAIKKESPIRSGVCPEFSSADKVDGISEARANTLVGMKEERAGTCASLLGWGYRISSRDGEDFPGTLDYRSDRISVTIKEGVITRVLVG